MNWPLSCTILDQNLDPSVTEVYIVDLPLSILPTT